MADVQPTPKNQPSMLSIANSIALVLISVLSAYNSGKTVVPVVPDPSPIVKPIPPTPIDNGVKIVQHGKPVSGSVAAGRMFSIIPDDGLTITPQVEAEDSDDIEVEEVSYLLDGKSKPKLNCTLNNGKSLSVIVSGGVKPVIVRVTCNTAPNPPPVVPVVNPVNPPSPNPSPVINAGVRVILLRSPAKAMTADQVIAFNSPKVAAMLDAKCMKDAANLPAWHRWDSDIKNPPPAWSKLMEAIQAKMTADKIECPLMAVQKGMDVTLYGIDNEAALINTLNQVFGGAS